MEMMEVTLLLLRTSLSPTPPPDPNVTKCEIESCIAMPSDCGTRPECAGCGALCFNSNADNTAYNHFLADTGLGEQALASQAFPDMPFIPGQDTPPRCPWPVRSGCLRGMNQDVSTTIARSDTNTTTACCSFCTNTPGCVAWQLITKRGAHTTECWAMNSTNQKPNSPDVCLSAIAPITPIPEVRTADIVIKWKDVEPSAGNYTFSMLDTAADRAHVAGGKLILVLWTGQDAPHWLYSPPFGVGVLARNRDSTIVVPDYTSEIYQVRLRAVHAALARVIAETQLSSVVLAVQPCVGSTGDDTPVHLTSQPAWAYVNRTLLARIGGPGSGSDSTFWMNFFRGFASWLSQDPAAFALPIARKELVLLLNAQGESFPLDWIQSNLPGSYLKFGQAGHEYQSNYERFRAAQHAPFTYGLQQDRPVRSRAELSAETCWSAGPFQNASACPVPWNVYAMVAWLASVHLDFWNLQPNSVPNAFSKYRPLWRLLNRYAGTRWAWQSPGAWVAFRDGLDAMDVLRFPEAEFGALSLASRTGDYPEITCHASNEVRALAICSAHAAQGCSIDVPTALCGGPMKQRRARGMNDVAFGNWRGNYGGFMEQLEPESTRGWWRVGNRSALFGRFAKGFAYPGNSTAVVPLRLDRGLWGGLPLTEPRNLTLRVIFLDGVGSFAVGYDSLSGPKVARTIIKGNSRDWQELCILVPDGAFRQRGPAKADVWLLNADEHDDIFDSVELVATSKSNTALLGCSFDAEPIQS